MIAQNYRRHADALALQLPLPFGHVLRWALPRPGSRVLRAIRAARGHAFALAGRLAYPTRPTKPQWLRDSQKNARKLAQRVKLAQRPLIFADHAGRAQHVAWCREQFDRYTFSLSV